MVLTQYHAVGKRRTAIARIWARPGEGDIQVNRKKLEDYFPLERGRQLIMQPLQLTGMLGRLDIKVNVHGGGILGQADAIRHGISRALLEVNPEFRDTLKRAGFLKRDSRIKERKKYGKRGARASYQYSKR
ncbi:MAG: 30S ribosomal protein S9 [Deltaproteobacteria bacterium]|nr:30S ribosomal protein S9 [Deltaproteobacteria bacterium]MBW2306463.1 30S ribosomal protein S9 [Deltaproteobacteria bacterium]